MISGERHFQSIEGEIDIGAVLISSRCEVTLNHLNGVLRHAAAVLPSALPVTISDFGDDFAPLLDGLQNSTDIKMPVQRAFDPDFDVVEVYKYSNLKTILDRKSTRLNSSHI